MRASDASTFTVILPMGDDKRVAWGLTNDGADCWTSLGKWELQDWSDLDRLTLQIRKDLLKVLRAKSLAHETTKS